MHKRAVAMLNWHEICLIYTIDKWFKSSFKLLKVSLLSSRLFHGLMIFARQRNVYGSLNDCGAGTVYILGMTTTGYTNR